MDKKLEKMRAKIRVRIKRNALFLVAMTILMVVAISGIIPIEPQTDMSADSIKGYQAGIMVALVGLAIAYIIRDAWVLRDDTKLKRLFYKENDEREKYINQKVGCSSMKVITVVMALISIVASYFNFTVFVTMVVMIYLQALVQAILRSYYNRRLSSGEMESDMEVGLE